MYFQTQLLLMVAATSCVLANPSLAQKRNSPHRTVKPIPIADMKWTDGFWHDRYATCRDKMVPSMWEIMKGTKYKPFLEHFRIAAGLSEGGYHGAKWNDGDFYKWIEAVCAVQAIERNPKWDRRLDEIISVIGKAQRADGYIHTPVLVAARNGDESAKPFADRFNFEVYNMGHLMTAACRHHEVTGKSEFVAIARKAADFLDGAFRNPTPETARHAICPSHYMGILDLYRTTGERRYLELAQRLIRMRDLVTDGGDDNQDRVPFLQQNEAVGHAVRATYLYAGVADLYAETGDEKLHSTLDKLWQNVVEKKMYITGACGALHDGASPDGSKNQKAITRVHQAFGRNYQLPITKHNGPQRDVCEYWQRALELANVPEQRRGEVCRRDGIGSVQLGAFWRQPGRERLFLYQPSQATRRSAGETSMVENSRAVCDVFLLSAECCSNCRERGQLCIRSIR